MTPETQLKRNELLHFIRVKMESESAVKGVVAVGSIGAGTAHADSDIDAVVFLDPYDLYVVPAEAVWREEDDTFHSIFTSDESLLKYGLQVDFNRLNFKEWSDPACSWTEPMKSEIGSGWIAFDPTGEVGRLITHKTFYDDSTRLKRLDEAIVWLDQLLNDGEPDRVWNTYDAMVAHDRLNAAYDYLVQMIFAYNRKWRTWKTREMTTLVQLPWRPRSFEEHGLSAIVAMFDDYEGYKARAYTMSRIFDEMLDQLIVDGTYQSADPVGEAFIRNHEEPGRAWNIRDWMQKHNNRGK
ncbi:nucleotidyltransferase domain-containing protein [Alicyclobacillus mengziensis]|uniref:Nucleotidyltransferase domain-containing protein n=1 Tax=Alicyclobacillus mengziensis TaxID=2931921 RepID=A0A9X7VY25_9BACL|nr:nucleotidyltransferase domain-containing protein [Alicyclobacillus mengziensis]QSO46710.1 nucleotidyltransferase domain-containing protein [Alicyclobacillus mengziensis]